MRQKPVDLQHCTKRDKRAREQKQREKEKANEEIKYKELGEISRAIK